MLQNVKVLVVEDILIAQKIAKLTLLGLGCTVHIAETGMKGLQMAEQNRYQLILMDLGLPDISGIELTRLIRNSKKINYHVPIIALTATIHEDDRQLCLEAGMDDFIVKPLTSDKEQTIISMFVKLEAS
jgi:CheY-like chemotaxis protein